MRFLTLAFALLALLAGGALAQSPPTPVLATNPVNGVGVPAHGIYCIDANGNAQVCPLAIITPSTADANATAIAAANTWQPLFNAGYGTHGTYLSSPSAEVCVGTAAQTGSCTCPNTGGAQNVLTIPALTVNFPFGVNQTAMSICSATAGAYFSKGGY